MGMLQTSSEAKQLRNRCSFFICCFYPKYKLNGKESKDLDKGSILEGLKPGNINWTLRESELIIYCVKLLNDEGWWPY